MITSSLSNTFDEYFSIVPATTEELIKEVYKLRHKVYCEELGYEPTRKDRLEFDAHDLRSVHCLLLHKASGEYAGCVRLVLSDPHDTTAPFPFEHVCNDVAIWQHPVIQGQPRTCFGEISRLAIISHFRRRRGESNSPDGGNETLLDDQIGNQRRRFPSIALGLYVAITAMGLKQGLDGVFAMMEPRLARQLHRFGIHFEQIGNPVEHRGLRVPFFVSRGMIYQSLKPEIMELLSSIEAKISSVELKASLTK